MPTALHQQHPHRVTSVPTPQSDGVIIAQQDSLVTSENRHKLCDFPLLVMIKGLIQLTELL